VLPPLDPARQRIIDVMERPLGRLALLAGRRMPDPVERPPRLGLLLGLVAQEGVLERRRRVRGIQRDRVVELLARQYRFADLQIGVRQILANRCPPGREGNRRLELRDRRVVIVGAKRAISAV
jgi:hypothetical protein